MRLRQSIKGRRSRGNAPATRGGKPAPATYAGNKVAPTRKSGTVPPRLRDEPKSVSFERKDEISAAKAYLATIEREKRAKRARDEFKNYHKGAKKAVSTLEKGYEDLPIEARFKVEKNMNKLFDDRNKQSRQAKKNRARYEKKFKEEERDLPKKLPYESELIRGARLSLAEEILGAFLVAINETGEKKRATRAANKKMDKGFGSDAIKKKFELTDDEKSRADAAYEKDGHAGYITALGRIYQKRTGRGRRDPNERYP